MRAQAEDRVGGMGHARVRTFRTRDLADLMTGGDEATLDTLTERDPPRVLRAAKRLAFEGVLPVRRVSTGKNVWTDSWLNAALTAWRDGTALRVTHVELGTGAGVPARTDVAVSGALAPRKPITEAVRDGTEYLRTSTFLTSSDYAGQTLTRVGLWTAIVGGTIVNHLALSPSLVKLSTESAIVDVDLRLVPV